MKARSVLAVAATVAGFLLSQAQALAGESYELGSINDRALWNGALVSAPSGLFAFSERSAGAGRSEWVTHRSRDGGKNWERVDTFRIDDGDYCEPRSMLAEPAYGDVYLYGVCRGGGGAGYPTFVRKTEDGGNTWFETLQISDYVTRDRSLTVDSEGAIHLLSVVDRDSDRVTLHSVSKDRGRTWTQEFWEAPSPSNSYFSRALSHAVFLPGGGVVAGLTESHYLDETETSGPAEWILYYKAPGDTRWKEIDRVAFPATPDLAYTRITHSRLDPDGSISFAGFYQGSAAGGIKTLVLRKSNVADLERWVSLSPAITPEGSVVGPAASFMAFQGEKIYFTGSYSTGSLDLARGTVEVLESDAQSDAVNLAVTPSGNVVLQYEEAHRISFRGIDAPRPSR